MVKILEQTAREPLYSQVANKIGELRLYSKALAEKISIAPGPMFSPRQDYRNFIRLSCGEPWSPQLERAIGVLAYLVKQMC
jgi:DNA-binding transcriptional MocR family regulator